MFDTLAPKLNGGNLPSGQTNNQGNNAVRGVTGNNTLVQGNSTLDLNAQPSSNNRIQLRAGIHPTPVTPGATSARSFAQPLPSAPTRQFKAFAKGFSGLGADVISDLSRSSDERQGVANHAVSKKTMTTTDAVYTLPELGSRKQQGENSTTSYETSGSGFNGKPSASAPTVSPATDADTSFGGDDFYLGAEDLADLENDLDQDQGRNKGKDKENEDDENISLSWSPTPPKAGRASILTPVSPQSPLSRFSTTARSTGVNSTISYASAFAYSPTSTRQDSRLALFVLQSFSDGNGNGRAIQIIISDIVSQGSDRVQGFSRSKSSPNAGSGSTLPIRGKSRLPGPAGNLPRLSEEEKDRLFRSRGVPFRKDTRIPDTTNTSPNSSIKKKMKTVSQGPIDSMFASTAWEEMLKSKHLPEYKPSTLERLKGTNPLLQVTISDIETRQNPHRGKIPWLIAVIKDFIPSEIDAAVTLMDPSGEMRGTIHISVLEQYKNNEIRIGTVLVLNNLFPGSTISKEKEK
ncbi:hypothetical protein BGZ97_001597 [Linnemannia gamsii]|uniref:Homologous recombination OB-fold protein OB-fold domain-containing protein n=1 Tax=Linnemannia gamsii TaxID=64522 RepID=A0A9P6UUG6_9FUNG|nr:hypothetical protein BGZ97_001597 [Linnemannia gamsii]